MIRKVELLHDCPVKDVEDGYFTDQDSGIFGVFDGVSAPHSTHRPMERYGQSRLSGGTVVVNEINSKLRVLRFEECVVNIPISAYFMPLEAIMKRVNDKIGDVQRWRLKLPLDQPEFLPGATLAAAKIGDEITEIIQCGDSLALWLRRDGTYGITPDQVSAYKGELGEQWKKLVRKHLEICAGDIVAAHDAAWDELLPVYTAWRRRNTNNRESPNWYGLLNGEPRAPECWFSAKVPTKDIELILLFTDGLVNFEDFYDESALAHYMIKVYRQSGSLNHILESTRYGELLKKENGWAVPKEATAISIHIA